MDELEKKPADQQDSVLFEIGVEELARRAYPTFRIGTYEQIKNSGSLRYFTNKTAAALVEYESYRTVLDKQLEIENKYGDFQNSAFTDTSSRQIIVCKFVSEK